MKKIPFVICIFFLTYFGLSGQDTLGLSRRLSTLEVEFKTIQNQLKDDNRLHYQSIRTNLITALELQNQIETVYTYIKGDVETADIYNKLARVNSPVSDILGFKFSTIILNKTKEVFNSKEFSQMPPKKKSKFLEVINKIVNNPIASAIQSTFPFTGTIRSVVTAAATFFSEPTVELNLSKERGELKAVNVKEVKGDTGLSNEFIEKYLSSLSPYIVFYEKLEYSNLQYEISNANLLKTHQNLPVLIKSFKKELHSKLGLTEDMILAQKLTVIDNLLEYNLSGGSDFIYRLSSEKKSKIFEANNIAKQIGMTAIELENFYSEFVSNVQEKLNSDKNILNDAKKLEGAKEESISALQRSIQDYLTSGAISKYSERMSNIKNLKNRITY